MAITTNRFALSLCASALLLGGCALFGSPPPEVPEPETSEREEYVLGNGDTVRIDVWETPEFSGQAQIRPDGKISLPLIGDVQASGLTPIELGARIEQALSKYVVAPRAVVIVEDLSGHGAAPPVRILGAVKKPQSITYARGMTVLDTVLMAGGFHDANRSEIKIYRQTGSKTSTRTVSFEQPDSPNFTSQNLSLKPGDIVFVPEKTFLGY